ncbi:hypothetical protein AAFF_G00023020 [Aldrovandia affinis]|uniref:Uncharacterized protein n=1 Tax=Aldrovandia affinis TaxID=143900 RepID=A0AAD7X0D3_9TELE|nr:hypothetical protein AAFF_G00023020 [Aldrovandia affinis]
MDNRLSLSKNIAALLVQAMLVATNSDVKITKHLLRRCLFMRGRLEHSRCGGSSRLCSNQAKDIDRVHQRFAFLKDAQNRCPGVSCLLLSFHN